MHFVVKPANVHDATVSVPGDKSISHRALMLGSVATGLTEISGFLNGEDCLATLAAARSMGVRIDQHDDTTLTVHGAGLHGLAAPANALDMGNSGTAMRLLAGLLAGQSFDAHLVGDASLSARPMGRVIAPLTSMGARIDSSDGRPPLHIHGGSKLRGIEYEMPVASAQVKSALLLAGLYAEGETRVIEPAVTRDHTERMLESMGVDVVREGSSLRVAGGQTPVGCQVRVPGDLSSAAFVLLAAIISDGADVCIEGVGMNPTRTGVIDILQAMGADIRIEKRRSFGAEPVADIGVRSSRLQGCAVDPALVSLAIDEFPVLFVAAAFARGVTTFSGIGELRIKESDRIAAMAAGLRALGVRVDEAEDGAAIHGGRFLGGRVESFGDHRIAMSFAVGGAAAEGAVTVSDTAAVATSFPGFPALMASLGIDIEVHD